MSTKLNFDVVAGQRRVTLVRVHGEDGEVLSGPQWVVYGGAVCDGFAPVRMTAVEDGGWWRVELPGLRRGAMPWRWQIFLQERATGVEWLLAEGDVRVRERRAEAVAPADDEVNELVCVLSADRATVDVTLGESTAEAVLAVEQAREYAGHASIAAHDAKTASTAALSSAATANVRAEAAARDAELAGSAAESAAEHAAEAKGFAQDAGEGAAAAGDSAAAAATSSQEAARAAGDALMARDTAVHAAEMADERKVAAEDAAADAEDARAGADEAAARAVAGAAGAQADASAAAESARAAAESAANSDVHWRAYYKSVTSLPTGYMQGATITVFEYDMPKLTSAQGCFQVCKNLKRYKGSLKALTNGRTFFTDCFALVIFESDLSALTSAYGMFYGAALERFDTPLPKLADGSRMYVDCRNLQIFASELPSLSTGTMMFTSCQLNKESALRVLGSIPAYESGSHPLTIGIHVDNKTDEDVLLAIDGATANGWTVTVQWNGKATVSTFSLRPTPPPPVYVKREQAPDGEYEDARGTRYAIDWGHEVVSPQGEPEALGYELFESVEAALEEWGLAYVGVPTV